MLYRQVHLPLFVRRVLELKQARVIRVTHLEEGGLHMVVSNDNHIVPSEYDIFIGMDVDKKSISFTVYNHKEKLRSMKISYRAEALMNYANKHFSNKRIVFAYEVGPTGYGLYDKLTEGGYRCLVINPSSIPTLAILNCPPKVGPPLR